MGKAPSEEGAFFYLKMGISFFKFLIAMPQIKDGLYSVFNLGICGGCILYSVLI
jgi:hypothetical protein